MRKIILFSISLLALSCGREPKTEFVPGSLEVRLSTTATKASEYDVLTELELTINNYEILVFGADGRVVRHLYTQTGGTVGQEYSESFSLPVGEYTVYALINGGGMAAEVDDVQSLLALNIGLAECNSRSGLIQIGSSTATVALGSSTIVEIQTRRLVARVHLDSVRNNLPESYGDIKVLGFLLANVVGNENLASTAVASQWLNRYGRSTVSNKHSIIDGQTYKASASAMTWKGLSAVVPRGETSSEVACNLYCYRNTLDNDPQGWSAEFEPCATVAVLMVAIGDGTYYYPVRINSYIEGAIAPNYSYSMALTLNNLGSKDPAEMIYFGEIEASITVDKWGDGGEAEYRY